MTSKRREKRRDALRITAAVNRRLKGSWHNQDPKSFGHIRWMDDDIQATAQQEIGRKLTDEELQSVRDSYAVRNIDDEMAETGWDILESAVHDAV